MSLFTIDPTKCRKDHICAAVCPFGLIDGGNGLPRPVPDAEALCVSCGHCVSACSAGALSHRAMTPEQCEPIDHEHPVTADQAGRFLRERRSIRAYKRDRVDKGLIEDIIRTASYGPSGHNTQPVEWIVVHDPPRVERIAGLVVDWMRYTIQNQPDFARAVMLGYIVGSWESGKDTICRNAPHVVLTHAHKDNMMAPSACTIALAYLDLAARANGLGACWAGYVDLAARYWQPLREELGMPADHTSYGAMLVGYPKYRYYRIPKRREVRITWK